MELETTKSYKIEVRDDDKNKCSKDCHYMLYDSYFDSIVCILERCTSGIIDDERFNGINRTAYCKEFFKE